MGTKKFDDNAWQNVDPTQYINDFVELRKSEIGWLRLHVHINQSLLNKPVAFKIRQIGASEIYINGKIVLRLGNVSTNPKQEVIFNPNDKPYSFTFTNDTEQVIAVHYSFTHSNPYFNNQGFGNLTFIFQLVSAQAGFNELTHQKSYSSAITFAEVGFLLFLLHLFFYLAYKEKKSNLYYSVFAFLS